MYEIPVPVTQNGTPTTADQPILDVRHLTVAYADTRALEDVSFTVAPGERVAVVGPNGAGKSTLLKTLVGLIRPASGTIQVGGHLHTQCSDVAYVPQRAQVDWSFPIRVWDVVMLGRTAHIGWLAYEQHSTRKWR